MKSQKSGKMLYGLLCFAAMFCLIVSLILTCTRIVADGDKDYRFFRQLYIKYHVSEDLDMEMESIMEVTGFMMDYLMGREERLSIVTDVDGRRQDFFNEQDRFHMEEVRDLFLGGIKLRNILLAVTLLILLVVRKQCSGWQRVMAGGYLAAFAVALLGFAFIAVMMTRDFTQAFTLFHELFFDNDLWKFDPETDYMIRMLPEGFFMEMGRRILICFVAAVSSLGVWALVILKKRPLDQDFAPSRRKEKP